MTPGRLEGGKSPGIEDDEGAPRHWFSPCTDGYLESVIMKGFPEKSTG